MIGPTPYRAYKHAVLFGSVAMFWGYTRSALQRLPRYEDREFRLFVGQYQYVCLLYGKAAATARLNARQESEGRRSDDATGGAIGAGLDER